ncbi:MAG: SUKH-3 domain-containing protein [Thermoflexibacter sp.]|jgi:hypothetical protein|nr:SUKH-3 domain-containing protein [Thermoflexibacter sp.]
MHTYTNEIKTILLNSKWREGRKVWIYKEKMCLAIEKYILTPKVEIFLQEYSGLSIYFKTISEQQDFFHFDVCKVIEEFDKRWIDEDYINRISTSNLCVIGQAYSNHLTLLMDELGTVYGGYDDLLYLIGKSGEEAIENLITKKGIIEIM